MNTVESSKQILHLDICTGTVLVNVALEPANCELIISMSKFDERSITFKIHSTN